MFVYKRIQVYDAPASDLLSHADEAVNFISSGLCHGSVLIHCHQGISRSTTCLAFYLVRKIGLNLQDAMALIQEKRRQAQPIANFMEQLREYESKCRELGVIKASDDTRAIRPSETRQGLKRIGPSMPPSEGNSKKAKVIGPLMRPPIPDGDALDPSVAPTFSSQATQSPSADDAASGYSVSNMEVGQMPCSKRNEQP